jgi:hypothetical protein
MSFHNHPRELMKPNRSLVVAHSLPCPNYGRRLCLGKRRKTREQSKEEGIFLKNATDLRLLKHDFGDENAVQIAFTAPR